MKRVCIALAITASSTAFAQGDRLTLASDVWPPFTNTAGERSVSTDIVKEALRRIDIGSELVITDFDSVLAGLDQGRFNGSAALWRTKEREERMIFSNAYLQNQLILVGRKGSDPNIASPAELRGKRIGLVGGYAYDDAFVNDPLVHLVFGESDQQNLERLLAGEIDLMLVDELLIQYLLKYEMNDVSTLLEFAKVPLMHKPLYFALTRKTPQAEQIIARFNSTIQQMIADGTYNQLLQLSWIRADVDGNGTLELIYNGSEAGLTPPTHVYALQADSQEGTDAYYVNGNMYASWNDIPADHRVAPRTLDLPPVVVPNDGLIRF